MRGKIPNIGNLFIRANKFRDEWKAMSESKAALEEKIKHLEIQVKNREKEIERLQAKLDITPQNPDKLVSDYQNKTTQEKDRKSTRLNSSH